MLNTCGGRRQRRSLQIRPLPKERRVKSRGDRSVIHSKNVKYSISSKSKVLTGGKVPGRAHASAADRESTYFLGGSWAPKNRSKNRFKIRWLFGVDLDRFGVVLGRQLGVIFGLFAAQVRPSSLQNASCKPVNVKIVNFAPVLRFPIPERFLWPQDGSQNAPRSAQDGSKRLLKTIFCS